MEPERRIEKLLRAFAKKRREQAGEATELRPSAREQLHKEVARRSAVERGGFFSNLMVALRPRLAFAVCFVAVICVGGWLLLPALKGRKPATLASANVRAVKVSPADQARSMPTPSPEVTAPTLARNEAKESLKDKRRSDPAARTLKLEPPAQTAASQPPTMAENDSAKQITTLNRDIAPTSASSASTLAATPPSNAEKPVFKTTASDSVMLAKDTPALPADEPIAVTNSFAMAGATLATREQGSEKKSEAQKQPAASTVTASAFYENSTGEITDAPPVASQRFYRVDTLAHRSRATGAASVRAPVLSSFRVEQNHGEMRVVDADGSIYTGTLLAARETNALADFSATPKSEAFGAAAVKTGPQSQAVQNYFRVAGTNRSLNQNVIFSGHFIPFTNALLSQTNANALGGAYGVRGTLSESRITGKAEIGNQNAIEVNAAPTP